MLIEKRNYKQKISLLSADEPLEVHIILGLPHHLHSRRLFLDMLRLVGVIRILVLFLLILLQDLPGGRSFSF